MNINLIKASVIALTAILLSGCASTSEVKLAGEQAAAAQKTANEAKMSAAAAMSAAEAAKLAAEEAKKSADAARQATIETNSKIDQAFRKSMRK